MGQFNTLDDIIGVLRRRFALILGLTLVGAMLSLFYATSLPRIYETRAVIQVELPNVAIPSGTSSSGSQAKHRLHLIEQQLMARDSLTDMIEDLGLFSDAELSDSQKVNALRLSVSISQIIDPADAWRPDAVPSGLYIGVRMGDADQAALVANTFLDRILAQSEARRHQQTEQALSFFESEATRVDSIIAELEGEIALFKQNHAASMPAGIPSLHDQMAILRETELEIQRQIIGLKTSASRVREDVLERQLSELEAQNNLIIARISGIQAALAAAPQVEREFSRLSRELTQLQEQFIIITQRRAEAEMGQMLEARHQSERFEVLETALVPEHPVSPSRKKILAAGIALFMVLGAGIAILLELLNPAIRTAAQLERALGIAPIVSIPVLEGKGRGQNRLGIIALFGAGLVAVVVAVVAIMRTIAQIVIPYLKAIRPPRRRMSA